VNYTAWRVGVVNRRPLIANFTLFQRAPPWTLTFFLLFPLLLDLISADFAGNGHLHHHHDHLRGPHEPHGRAMHHPPVETRHGRAISSRPLRDRGQSNAFARSPYPSSTFSCKTRGPGYYADTTLDCQVRTTIEIVLTSKSLLFPESMSLGGKITATVVSFFKAQAGTFFHEGLN